MPGVCETGVCWASLRLSDGFLGFLRGVFSRGGVFLGNPKDSVWEDRGTLGKTRGITTPLKNPINVFCFLEIWMVTRVSGWVRDRNDRGCKLVKISPMYGT